MSNHCCLFYLRQLSWRNLWREYTSILSCANYWNYIVWNAQWQEKYYLFVRLVENSKYRKWKHSTVAKWLVTNVTGNRKRDIPKWYNEWLIYDNRHRCCFITILFIVPLHARRVIITDKMQNANKYTIVTRNVFNERNKGSHVISRIINHTIQWRYL